MQKIVLSLQQKDSFVYAQVFPSADTMNRITLRKAPSSSDAYQKSTYMISSPEFLMAQDSLIQKQAWELFRNFLNKSKKMVIHWESLVMSRYELEALAKTRDDVLEAIVPERFVGYIFLEDIITRKIYTLTLSDILKMDGKWYGGELNYIFEANSKDGFNAQLKAEKIRIRKGLPETAVSKIDSLKLKNEEEEEEEPIHKRKQVVDRKLYFGYLDNEIQVSLYIRSIKGDCPDGVCTWEAIFKFGDNEYSRQEVSRNEDGNWVFVEEETGGVMELNLKGDTFTGTFSATLDKVDYDAQLKEKPMTNKKLESLDAIIEKGMVH
ncbi:MAG: hypothetical protein QM530_04670 [Phycisphaerales bacterium]|nr:hypothetical protein [Phycisphaerales bacterium]